MQDTLNRIGTLTFDSGFALIGDPCYLDDDGKKDAEYLLEVVSRESRHAEADVGFALPVPTTPATVLVGSDVDYDGYESARLLISFTGEDFRHHTRTEIGHARVDTAQMMVSDLVRAITDYKDTEYQDIRIFRHKEKGTLLQYGVDFVHFQAPIPSQGGANMNELNATGEWDRLPPSEDQLDFSYNGVCKYNDKFNQTGGIIEGFATITSTAEGDGSYPVTVYRDSNNNLQGFMIDFNPEQDNESYEDNQGQEEDETDDEEA